MIHLYKRADELWRRYALEELDSGEGNIWIDMISPAYEEIIEVQNRLSIEIPSRAEMQEIEATSRLYQEKGAYFMTATIVTAHDYNTIESSAITYILSDAYLVTVRYQNPNPFVSFAARLQRPGDNCLTSADIMIGLMEAVIDRMADILEVHCVEVANISQRIFSSDERREKKKIDLHATIKEIGVEGNHLSILRESLVSINRMVIYLNQAVTHHKQASLIRDTLKEIGRDLSSLTDHASFMSNKINFLLDATLGMINIEQNQIIKIFSVAAVVFLPPTLIASIYGMNFKFIPELGWDFGYPFAIVIMILSGILPFVIFKRKGWL